MSKQSDGVATAIFRILVGILGLSLLFLFLWKGNLWDAPLKAIPIFAGLGLFLGYAFGGDKWGARLFGFFTGSRIVLEESKKDDPDRKPEDSGSV